MMNNRLDSLFGRLVVMTVGLIMTAMLTMVIMIERDRTELDILHISKIVLVAMGVHERFPEQSQIVAGSLGVSYVDLQRSDTLLGSGSPKDTYGPVEDYFRTLLPPGSHVVLDQDGTLRIGMDGKPYAVRIDNAIVPKKRFARAFCIVLGIALLFSMVFAWHLLRPIRELTEAARAYRVRRACDAVSARGPRELRDLVDDFNDMVSESVEYEREREVMLASIAHDLRAPITRMQVRADLLGDSKERSGFLRDAESMSAIITQFLDFARENSSTSGDINVDEFCRKNYTDALCSADQSDAIVRLNLAAGPGFMLPTVDIDRILSNLVENAMSYGTPPIEITTAQLEGSYVLRVRDCGHGVPEADLERVARPFVRLDAARGGNAHCGLGLAIVRRLVRTHRGTLQLSNAPDGGFVATMTFPDRIS